MKVTVGTKATLPIANGLRWPGVAISDETVTKTTVINKSTGQPVVIDVTRADFISLRSTNPVNPTTGEPQAVTEYLTLTSEVVQYGYRPIAEPRFSNVAGLDVDGETGEVMSLDRLIELRGAAYSAFQLAQFELRRGATSIADLGGDLAAAGI